MAGIAFLSSSISEQHVLYQFSYLSFCQEKRLPLFTDLWNGIRKQLKNLYWEGTNRIFSLACIHWSSSLSARPGASTYSGLKWRSDTYLVGVI